MKKQSLPHKSSSNVSEKHNQNLKMLTLITAFLSCFMLFVTVSFYAESVRLAKRNGELELQSIQLEGEVNRLRDKRMLDAINAKKQEYPATILKK
jgi:hypothetical protein